MPKYSGYILIYIKRVLINAAQGEFKQPKLCDKTEFCRNVIKFTNNVNTISVFILECITYTIICSLKYIINEFFKKKIGHSHFWLISEEPRS